MRLFRSIRFQLTLWFVALLALITAGFSVFIFVRQGQVLRAETEARLQSQAAQLAGYYDALVFRGEEAGEREHTFRPFEEELPLLQPHDVLALIDRDGQVLQKTENLSGEDLQSVLAAGDPGAQLPSGSTFRLSTGEQGPQDYMFVASPLGGEEAHGIQLLLGSPFDPANQLTRLGVTLGLVFAATLLAAFGGGFWLADRAMQPVQAITRTAREIGERDLSRRLRLDRTDELGELADTFDRMLDRLEAAFNRQRQFTADASHELRTPLTIIELEANRALERPRKAGEYVPALRTIQAENERMARLVNELLTLARLDSGQLQQSGTEMLDLSELAVDAVERLSGLAKQRGVRLQTGELTEAPVEAERGYLLHMITNLVENGLKYAQGDEARVVLSTGRGERAGRPASWVRVADNGPGIPREHLPRLFDRFYRVDEARSRGEDESASGSGLGLAIVQSIAERYGGEVTVESRPGDGTVFTIWFS